WEDHNPAMKGAPRSEPHLHMSVGGCGEGVCGSQFVGLPVGPCHADLAGVVVEGDGPAAFVDADVVVAAEAEQGGDVGAAAEDPGEEVVDVYPCGGGAAAGPA